MCCDQPLEVDDDQLRGSSKLILLKLHEKLPRNSTSTILWSFGVWSKLERWKSLITWVPHELTKNLKKSLFWSVVFSYCAQWWPISWSDCDVWWEVDFTWQPVTTSSVVELRRSSKALPKAKLAPKKGHGLYLVVFHPLRLSESQWNHYICKVCSANRWDALKTAMPASGFGQQKGPHSSLQQQPTARCITNTSKVEWIGCEVLPHLAYSPNLSWTDYHFFKHLNNFCRENASTTSRRQKILFESLSSPKAQIFMLHKRASLFLIVKNVLIVMVPISINKDVFEPSYNDLKFMVENPSYFCTNLMNLKLHVYILGCRVKYISYWESLLKKWIKKWLWLWTVNFLWRCLASPLYASQWILGLLSRWSW